MKKENIKLRDKITAFKSDYRGFVLVTVIMFMVLLVIIAVYFISVANTEQRAAGYSESSIQAELAAKSACSDFQSRITGKTIYGSRREKIWRQIALPVFLRRIAPKYFFNRRCIPYQIRNIVFRFKTRRRLQH